ncbi:permease [Aliikangiella sp. IMCC44359]|uniref:permease n=1 Tax=Aliikangiella sp. IMCC44359 TaxID=3459125 RepID=UPI00403AFDA3
MSNEFNQAIAFFVYAFIELSILFIGISFLVSVIQQKLPADKVKQLLSGNKGYTIAVSLGTLTPFCSCSTLPMVVGLLKARASFGPTMSFLLTSPLLNPFIIGLFWISFGLTITITYGVFVITASILGGILLEKLHFDRFIRQDIFLNSTDNQSTCNPKNDRVTAKIKWKKLLTEASKQFISFMPYLILGISIGAVLHGYVPSSAFESMATVSSWILIPSAAIIGVFLYVRASTIVPIASTLAAKGMSMGAIMSLTIGGAGASLPELIMLKRIFHWPLIFAFIFQVFFTACATGLVINLL